MTWIPLNVHSQFSILDSTLSVTAIAEKAKKEGVKAVALTDNGNLYGAVDFYKACKAASVKPIIGCEIWIAPSSRFDKKKTFGVPNGFPLLLLAKSKEGYQNLCRLSSIGFLEGFYYQPRIDKEVLEKHKEGLICITGGVGSIFSYLFQEKKPEELMNEILWYKSIFQDDFYLEIQRHPLNSEDDKQEGWLLQKRADYVALQTELNEHLIRISKDTNIPLVATHKIHYLEKEDFLAHEILLNIQSGEPLEIWERDSMGNPKHKSLNPKREVAPTKEFYFKSPQEMQNLFQDLPKAIEETVKIAEKCSCELDFKTKHYPVFIPPHLEGKTFSKEERVKEAENFLYQLCIDGIPSRYTPDILKPIQDKNPDKDPLQIVKDRFEYEFKILSSKGMVDYMLIVYDFIAWAKKQGIPIGPGRGSAAGSIISYLTGITDIEPLRFHLFFERFINPERLSYPDIDVDICMNRRGEIIDYVTAKYGKDKVAQIITFGTMKAKMAIRDVGRVLNVPLSKVNLIAALVPEDPTMTLEKAFEIDPELKKLMDTDEEARRVLEMAQKAEGSIRNTSTHAAGLIISGGTITDLIPVCTAKDSSMIVTQYAMKPVESVGMLKIDFLGLKTLTSLQLCAEEVRKNTKKEIYWNQLPLDDKPTFDIINQGKTLGIFQLESGGMADLGRQLHIDVFEEIIAVLSLYRPGPMDMIPSYISRKHGREAIEIDHPLMKDILAETYGVMVYQEQVMQIASALAGYSLGEGDVLRRAMGKKDKEEMSKQRQKFLEGALLKGIDEETSGRIFDKIEKFASYGFNKSHAAAYAYLSYATAYFKAHHPKEWMAALMTCDKDDISKVAKFIGEAKALGIEVLPPDINESGQCFSAASQGIRFALSAIKGVGSNVVDAIVETRKQAPFKDLYDFIQRMDKSRVGKKQIELLIQAGCFDFTKWSKDALLFSVETMFDHALKQDKEKALGILSLFSLIEEPTSFNTPPLIANPTSKSALLQREKELLGFYLTGHPMDEYKDLLKHLSCVPLQDFEKLSDHSLVRTAFIVDSLEIKISNKNQKKFAILTMSDGIERFELPIWSDLYEEKGSLLQENKLLYAILLIEKKEGSFQLSCKYLEDLHTMDEQKIQTADTLYDRLKMQTKNSEKWKKEKKPEAKEKEAPPPKEKEEIKHVILKIDSHKVRLSEIVLLKKLFRAFPGKSSVELQFFASQKHHATLAISSDWGIQPNLEFFKQLKTLENISKK